MAKSNYSGGKLFLDIILTLCTGGLWLIVPLLRVMRRNS